jgi:hypothetical protein
VFCAVQNETQSQLSTQHTQDLLEPPLIHIRPQNRLLLLLTFASCLSVFFIATINNQTHPEWLNLIAAILHAVLHAYTDLSACVILGPIRVQ